MRTVVHESRPLFTRDHLEFLHYGEAPDLGATLVGESAGPDSDKHLLCISSQRRLLNWRQLTALAIFAAAFGFAEAAVVVYLRAAVGLLPDYQGTLSQLQNSSKGYHQEQSISQFPQSLLTIEMYREAATMVMLITVAFLTALRTSARWAAFLWVFALWDSLTTRASGPRCAGPLPRRI